MSSQPPFTPNTPYTADEIFALAGGMLVKPFADSDKVSVTDVSDYSQYDFVETVDGLYLLIAIDGEKVTP
jgi:hypothetical protein